MRLLKKILSLRAVASSLCLVYLSTQVVFAHRPEANVWAERQKALRERSPSNVLLSQLPPAPPLHQAAARQTIASKDLPMPSILQNLHIKGFPSVTAELSSLVTLLSAEGVVRDIAPAKKPEAPVVVYIQDVHGQPEAQKNIGAMILKMLEKEPGAVVGLEGAAGRIPLEKFRHSSAEVNEEVGAFFRDEGIITGAEYAGFAVRTKPRFYGVEDKDLYLEHVAAVREALPLQKERLKTIEREKRKLGSQKKNVYSPAMLDLDQKWGAYQQGTLGLGDYLSFLVTINNQPSFGHHLNLFLETLALEKNLDFNRAEIERNHFLEKLTTRVDKPALENLVAQSVALRAGQMTFPDYYRSLKETALKSGVDLSQTPEFDRYLTYVFKADAIRPEALFAEISDYEKKIWNDLCQTPKQKSVYETSVLLALTEKLARLTLTPPEWEEYKTSNSKSKTQNPNEMYLYFGLWNLDLTAFESFYRLAEARNHSLAENFLKAVPSAWCLVPSERPGSVPLLGTPLAVLVAGGFHSEGLKAILADGSRTVITVSPKLTNVDSARDNEYLNVFTREKTPLEKIFLSQKISIVDTLKTKPVYGNGLDPNSVKKLGLGITDKHRPPTNKLAASIVSYHRGNGLAADGNFWKKVRMVAWTIVPLYCCGFAFSLLWLGGAGKAVLFALLAVGTVASVVVGYLFQRPFLEGHISKILHDNNKKYFSFSSDELQQLKQMLDKISYLRNSIALAKALNRDRVPDFKSQLIVLNNRFMESLRKNANARNYLSGLTRRHWAFILVAIAVINVIFFAVVGIRVDRNFGWLIPVIVPVLAPLAGLAASTAYHALSNTFPFDLKIFGLWRGALGAQGMDDPKPEPFGPNEKPVVIEQALYSMWGLVPLPVLALLFKNDSSGIYLVIFGTLVFGALLLWFFQNRYVNSHSVLQFARKIANTDELESFMTPFNLADLRRRRLLEGRLANDMQDESRRGKILNRIRELLSAEELASNNQDILNSYLRAAKGHSQDVLLGLAQSYSIAGELSNFIDSTITWVRQSTNHRVQIEQFVRKFMRPEHLANPLNRVLAEYALGDLFSRSRRLRTAGMDMVALIEKKEIREIFLRAVSQYKADAEFGLLRSWSGRDSQDKNDDQWLSQLAGRDRGDRKIIREETRLMLDPKRTAEGYETYLKFCFWGFGVATMIAGVIIYSILANIRWELMIAGALPLNAPALPTSWDDFSLLFAAAFAIGAGIHKIVAVFYPWGPGRLKPTGDDSTGPSDGTLAYLQSVHLPLDLMGGLDPNSHPARAHEPRVGWFDWLWNGITDEILAVVALIEVGVITIIETVFGHTVVTGIHVDPLLDEKALNVGGPAVQETLNQLTKQAAGFNRSGKRARSALIVRYENSQTAQEAERKVRNQLKSLYPSLALYLERVVIIARPMGILNPADVVAEATTKFGLQVHMRLHTGMPDAWDLSKLPAWFVLVTLGDARTVSVSLRSAVQQLISVGA